MTRDLALSLLRSGDDGDSILRILDVISNPLEMDLDVISNPLEMDLDDALEPTLEEIHF